MSFVTIIGRRIKLKGWERYGKLKNTASIVKLPTHRAELAGHTPGQLNIVDVMELLGYCEK